MDKLFEFSLLAFTTLFTMINPIGVIPVYTSLTEKLNSKQARIIALKATTTALAVLLLFAFGGKFIFDLFNISINGLRIVGGILFFMSGYDMLRGRLAKIKSDGEEPLEAAKDFAITPLGIPIITGPGAITVSIVYMNDAHLISHKIAFVVVIFLVIGMTHLILLSARKIISFIGENGNKLFTRLMGIIVMVIAVELFFGGLKPILQNILGIS